MDKVKKIIPVICVIVVLFNLLYIKISNANNDVENTAEDNNTVSEDNNINEAEENNIKENKVENENVNRNLNETSVYESTENKLEINNTTQEENKKEEPKNIEDGYYVIVSALDNNKVLEIKDSSSKSGANLQLGQKNDKRNQKFLVKYNKEGFYKFINTKSNKLLDVAYGEQRSGANVWQYDDNNTPAQKWVLEDAGNGYFYIKSKCNGLYLDVNGGKSDNGTNIQTYSGNQTPAQRFKFEKTESFINERTVEDGYYMMASSLDLNKVVDVSEASKSNGANVHLWTNVDAKQQKFKITYLNDGYYKIMNLNSSKVLDVAYGGYTSGTNVWQYDSNNTDAQKWIIRDVGKGYYSLVSASGNNDLYLDVSNASTRNGANLQVYEGNNTQAQKFKFTKIDAIEAKKTIENGTYKIMSYKDTSKVVDIDQALVSNGANVHIWKYVNELQQKFRIEYLGDGYYKIKNIKSNKVLDVQGGNSSSGANVWQYESNGTDAQKWIIHDCGDGTYNIVSALNELHLDVEGGNTYNGANLQINTRNKNSSTQKFKFERVTAVELSTGTYGSSGLQVKGDSSGTSLKYYKIGNGPNVYFGTFAVHGFEDGWNHDGQVLTRIAEDFKNKMLEMQDEELANKWTIYLFPSVNPDGENYGWTNNGPGRTSLYSAAPNNKGIDINRCWSAGYTSQTKNSRNYNGTQPFQSYESRALRDFLLNKKSQNGQTVLVDLHGWLNETIGDEEIGRFYRSKYGMSKHIYTYGKGYLVNWARSNLGSSGRTARSSLVELPEYDQDSSKYINATIEMLRNIN